MSGMCAHVVDSHCTRAARNELSCTFCMQTQARAVLVKLPASTTSRVGQDALNSAARLPFGAYLRAVRRWSPPAPQGSRQGQCASDASGMAVPYIVVMSSKPSVADLIHRFRNGKPTSREERMAYTGVAVGNGVSDGGGVRPTRDPGSSMGLTHPNGGWSAAPSPPLPGPRPAVWPAGVRDYRGGHPGFGSPGVGAGPPEAAFRSELSRITAPLYTASEHRPPDARGPGYWPGPPGGPMSMFESGSRPSSPGRLRHHYVPLHPSGHTVDASDRYPTHHVDPVRRVPAVAGDEVDDDDNDDVRIFDDGGSVEEAWNIPHLKETASELAEQLDFTMIRLTKR